MTTRRITIVGASLAGTRAALALRREGFDGEIVLVGDEDVAPYDRPPLSKAYLTGEDPQAAIRPATPGLDDLDLTWRRGRRAEALDVADRAVTLDDGEVVAADGVLLACGASPRRLPDTDGVAGVHALRTVADAASLRADIDGGARRVVVIGAGFIGAEVAASCRTRGADVTIVEALDLPLARVLPPVLGGVVAGVHLAHGVDLRLGVGVERLDVVDGRVAAVDLSDGSTLPADVVVVGIGVAPNTAWLQGSGLTLENGVVCDETTLAAPGIVAAGDVARWLHPRHGGLVRIEHWDNAIEMGAHAARRLLAGDGPGEPYAPVPWFWSDQYDRKFQLAGRCDPTDLIEIVDGTLDGPPDAPRFVALAGSDDELKGVFGVNRPAVLSRWREHLVAGLSWDEAVARGAG